MANDEDEDNDETDFGHAHVLLAQLVTRLVLLLNAGDEGHHLLTNKKYYFNFSNTIKSLGQKK